MAGSPVDLRDQRKTCDACKVTGPASDRFCRNCGAKFAAASVTPVMPASQAVDCRQCGAGSAESPFGLEGRFVFLNRRRQTFETRPAPDWVSAGTPVFDFNLIDRLHTLPGPGGQPAVDSVARDPEWTRIERVRAILDWVGRSWMNTLEDPPGETRPGFVDRVYLRACGSCGEPDPAGVGEDLAWAEDEMRRRPGALAEVGAGVFQAPALPGLSPEQAEEARLRNERRQEERARDRELRGLSRQDGGSDEEDERDR